MHGLAIHEIMDVKLLFFYFLSQLKPPIQSKWIKKIKSDNTVYEDLYDQLKKAHTADTKKLEHELQVLKEQKVQFTYPGDSNYPDALLKSHSPPLFLSYLGRECWKNQNLITVVGTRHPSFDVIEWTRSHLYRLAQSGYVIISGAAVGCDQAAHKAALFCQKPTIAILPSGLLNPYPKNAPQLIDQILSTGGAILSEYTAFQSIRKWHFYQRNRILACLSPLTLVIQATTRSGSTLTARLALENGREVACLPSSPNNIKGCGTLKLIKEGAHLIRHADDVIELLDFI